MEYNGKAENKKQEVTMRRDVEIMTDANGNRLVRINTIRFKGKRGIDWDDVTEIKKEPDILFGSEDLTQ